MRISPIATILAAAALLLAVGRDEHLVTRASARSSAPVTTPPSVAALDASCPAGLASTCPDAPTSHPTPESARAAASGTGAEWIEQFGGYAVPAELAGARRAGR